MASTPELHFWDGSRWQVAKEMVLPLVNAADLVTGVKYTIVKLASTNWTTMGAATSNIGVTFTKNSTTPIGTGTANGPGVYTGKNPMLKLVVQEQLGAPREAHILISNRSLKPFTDNNEGSPVDNPQIGMFTGRFTEFMHIRLIDSATKHILFAGRIYEVLSHFEESQYGSSLEIKARDSLAEFANYDLSAEPNLAIYSSGTNVIDRRSDVIRSILNRVAPTSDLDTVNTERFHDSANKFTAKETAPKGGEPQGTYPFQGVSKKALKHIQDLAAVDTFTDSNELQFGYDFYVDAGVENILHTQAPPAQEFVYHKRLTEPTDDPQDYGLVVRYNLLSYNQQLNKDRTFKILSDYNFSELPDEVYTHAVVAYNAYESLEGSIVDEDKLPPRVEGGILGGAKVPESKEVEKTWSILYCDIPTTGSGAGTNQGRFRVDASGTAPIGIPQVSRLYNSTTKSEANYVGLVQYQSGTGDNQFILISHIGKSNDIGDTARTNLEGLSSTATLYEDDGDYGNGVQITLSGQAFPSNTLGIRRIAKMDLRDKSNDEFIREAVAAQLTSGTKGEIVQRGYCTIADFPHIKWTGTAQSSSSGNTLHLQQTAALTGIEKSYTVNHTDTNGNVYAGQINYVNFAGDYITSNLYRTDTLDTTSPVAFSGWSGSSGTPYTIIVPIRVGSTMFIDHRLAKVYGIHLITELIYTWQYGRVHTEFYTLGRNEGRGALPVKFPPSSYPISHPVELPQHAKDATILNVQWNCTDWNTLGWSIPTGGSGAITLRNNFSGGSHTITASNTDALLGGSPMVANKVYMLYFDHKTSTTQFQLKIVHGAGANYVRVGHYIEVARISVDDRGDIQGACPNFNLLILGDSTNSPGKWDGSKFITPNSLVAVLLSGCMQPYTHNLTILPGDAASPTAAYNTKATVFSGGNFPAGRIEFSDGTHGVVATTGQTGNPTLTGLTTSGDVRYIYFELPVGFKSGHTVTIGWTATYSDAVSNTRGLLAVATKPPNFTTTNVTSSTLFNDEVAEDNSAKAISIMMFRGHTDTISVNLLAARAITSRHITTGQIIAKDFRTAPNVGDPHPTGVGGIIIDPTRIAGYADSVGSNNPVLEFELRSATGKAYFDGGKAIIDCDGMRFYKSATHNATQFMVSLSAMNFGINMKGGNQGGGVAIKGQSWDGLLTSGGEEIIRGNIYTTGNGAAVNTNTAHSFFISANQTNLHLNSATHSILLDGNDGVKILHQTTGSASNDNYGLLFMEAGSASELYTADFVGLRGPGGTIANSTIYVLPEVVTGDDEKFLKITSITPGSGSITAPYIVNLDWAEAGATADAFKSIDIDNDWEDSGYSWGTSAVTASGEDVLYLVAGTGIALASDYSQSTGSDGAPAIRISATAVSGATLAFKTLTIGVDIYGSNWTTSGSEIAAADDDTLFLIPSGSIILERISSSERGFKWSLAPTVSTAHTWSGVQTFTGGSFLVNSGTIRLGDSTSDTMEVYAAGTYVSEQKFDATILLDEEASSGSYGNAPSGYGRLYVKQETPSHLYYKTSGGTETRLSSFNFKYIDIDNADSGYTWSDTNVVSAAEAEDVLYLVAGSNIDIQSDYGVGTGKPSIKISASSGSGDPDQNLWSSFSVATDGGSSSGSTSIPDTTADLYTFKAGSGIVLTGGGTGDFLKIAAQVSGTGTSGRLASWGSSNALNHDSQWRYSGTSIFPNNTTSDIGQASSYGVRYIYMYDGTQSNPSIRFRYDTDTGIYSGGAGAINFSCNSTPRVQINASGINMLGNDNSSYIYGVHLIRTNNGTASAPSYTFTDGQTSGMFFDPSGIDAGLYFSYGGSTQFILDASINYNNNKVYIQSMDSTSSGVYVKWHSGLLKQLSSTERAKMNIRDLDIDSSKIYDLVPKSFEFRKIKTITEIIEGQEIERDVLDENKRLTYTDSPDFTSFGMIAEAVNEFLPELVLSSADDGIPDGLDYPLLSVLLLAEMKNLKARIEVLEGI